LNVLGELIGVNTAIRGDARNIGLAFPVDRLRRLLPELLDIELVEYLDSDQEVLVTFLRVKPPTILRYRDRFPVRERQGGWHG